MDEFGLSEYCVDIHDLSPQTLIKTFDNVLANADTLRDHVPPMVASCQKALSDQFDELFPSECERVSVKSKARPEPILG